MLGMLVISLLLIPLLSLAQGQGGPETGQALVNLIERVANWLAALLFALAVIFILIAAFGYLTAGGDDEKIKTAKQKLVYAIIAVVIAALAFFIPGLVLNLLDLGIQATP